MRERALVFMDTENVFFFARREDRTEGVTDDHVEAARRLDLTASYFDVATRGSAVFRHLAEWLEKQYDVVGRSYGKEVAPGVEAVVDVVVKRRWLHLLVHEGKNVADRFLIEDLELRVAAAPASTTTVVVLTSDNDILEKAGRAAAPTGLDIMAVLGPRPLHPRSFDVGARFDPVRLATTLPLLYAEMVEREKDQAVTAVHVPVYHPKELLTRGHVRDRLLTSPDLDELERRVVELGDAARERALLDDRYERLAWIEYDAAERRESLTRAPFVP